MESIRLQYYDKEKRDEVFNRLRQSEDPAERQVVRWSDPVAQMISEEEFQLDEKAGLSIERLISWRILRK